MQKSASGEEKKTPVSRPSCINAEALAVSFLFVFLTSSQRIVFFTSALRETCKFKKEVLAVAGTS